MIPTIPRPLSPAEEALIDRLLVHADIHREPYLPLSTLRVVATCECQCGSVKLVRSGGISASAERAKILADAYGTVQAGHAVGLILWGTTDTLTSLEIYSLAFDPPYETPAPDSVADVPAGFDPAI